ncbi:hypothetical protein MKY20_11560 [Cytobacillus sp. FSL W8-0315]|uniref:hypothetical protein n=1 Tax=Cytobacillus sp. FSL W8-0315 TaxID=2921600 RepID=UPI0030F848BA
MAGFSYNYNGLKYKDAENQVGKQVNPLYDRAIRGVQQQRYQNDVQSGQVAAARGLGRSGLAADALNKNGIAAQSQIGDLNSQRASQIAEMANSLLERDKDRGMQARSQAYSEWLGQQNLTRTDRDFNYQKSLNDRNFNYQKQLNADEKKWREHTFNNMSAKDKLLFNYTKQKDGEDAAWRMFELKYRGELEKSMNDSQLSLYGQDFLIP